MNNGSWTPFEQDFVRRNFEKMTTEEMAENLCKSESAVTQFMSRNRIAIPRVKCNIVIELLTVKFCNPDYFKPTKKFYSDTGFTQKRWWNLYLGRNQITQDEFATLCDHLKISMKEAFESRQLQLFAENHDK